MWQAWLKSLELRAVDVASCLSIIGACIIVGLLTLKVPVHRAFHRARIKTVTVRLGSSHPGASLFVELPDGRNVMLDTVFVQRKLAAGVEICVQELTDAIRGGTWFQHTTPDRCVSSVPAPDPGLAPGPDPALAPAG